MYGLNKYVAFYVYLTKSNNNKSSVLRAVLNIKTKG